MAKKNLNQQAQQQENSNHIHDQQQDNKPATAAVADPSEKLHSLKSLNSMLLKETVERRQQVDSLEQAKEALQTELSHSVIEKEALEAELSRAGQETAVLEVEKTVFSVSMETQLAQLNADVEKIKIHHDSEIGVLEKKVNELMADVEKGRDYLKCVCDERDAVKGDLDVWVEEVNGLRNKMAEMQKLVKKSEDEVEDRKKAYMVLDEENKGREQAIAAALKEKSLVQGEMEKALMLIDNLKRELTENAREKKVMEVERSGQQVKIVELEKQVTNLNGIVLNLRNEERLLSAKVLELESRYGEAKQKEKEMLLEINAHSAEKRENQRNVEILMEGKDLVEKLLKTAVKKSEDLEQRIESIVRERNELEELKVIQQIEISELNNKAIDLKANVVTLKEACREHEDKERKLSSEIQHCKDTLHIVNLGKDAIQKHFDEEKKNGMELNLKISEKDKKIEETAKELEQTRNQCSNLLEEKEERKNAIKLLVAEKDMVRKSLLETQQEVDGLKVDLASAGVNSERALFMLKSMGSLLCRSIHDRDVKEDMTMNEDGAEKNMQPYLAELEAIKSAFKSKENMLEDLNGQLELLQTSLTNAHKKKSLWAMVCSATTVFAAASVAYVAKAR